MGDRVMSTLTLNGDVSGYVNISSPTTPTSYTITLPTAAPTANGQYLSATTAGVASWSTLGPATYATLVGYTTTVTSASPVTLTASSTYNQFFTGSTAQTVVLPVVSTLAQGWTYQITNTSTANLTVNSSGSNLVATVIPGTTVIFVCILTSGTTAASWNYEVNGFAAQTGTGNVVLATSPSITTATLTNPTITNYIETPYTATVTGTVTINLSNGTFQILTMTSATNLAVTMPTSPTTGQSFILVLKQPASGTANSVTWTTVKWSGGTTPTVTATVGKADIFTFIYDGTNWYGSYVQNYTV
jgi:hypothetical protein